MSPAFMKCSRHGPSMSEFLLDAPFVITELHRRGREGACSVGWGLKCWGQNPVTGVLWGGRDGMGSCGGDLKEPWAGAGSEPCGDSEAGNKLCVPISSAFKINLYCCLSEDKKNTSSL